MLPTQVSQITAIRIKYLQRPESTSIKSDIEQQQQQNSNMIQLLLHKAIAIYLEVMTDKEYTI
jgi:hypothetical protein